MIALRNILITVCLMMAPTIALAQSSIDKIVDSLEDDKNVQEVMYTEQRDPSSRKIVKSSRIIQFTNDKIAAKLISAFKKEREKAISYKANNNPSNTVYELSFNDGKGFIAKYTLVQQRGSSWVLSVSILHNRHKNRKNNVNYYTDIDECDDSNNTDDGELLTFVVNSNGINYNDCIYLPDAQKTNDESGKIVVARETDSGCETFVIQTNKNAKKGSCKRAIEQTSPSGKKTLHFYY